jgi:hypothetical protein
MRVALLLVIFLDTFFLLLLTSKINPQFEQNKIRLAALFQSLLQGVPFDVSIVRHVSGNRELIVSLKAAVPRVQASSGPSPIHDSERFQRLVV